MVKLWLWNYHGSSTIFTKCHYCQSFFTLSLLILSAVSKRFLLIPLFLKKSGQYKQRKTKIFGWTFSQCMLLHINSCILKTDLFILASRLVFANATEHFIFISIFCFSILICKIFTYRNFQKDLAKSGKCTQYNLNCFCLRSNLDI